MTAKPKFSAAPKPAASLTAEQARFVDQGRGKDKAAPVANDEPTHRLSVDLPRRLHARYKSACALAGIKMAPDLIAFIEKRTADLEKQNH